MTYTVRNLTSRLLCLHGSSGASYYIHGKKSLEMEDVEVSGNPMVEKLLKRNIVEVKHHVTKRTKDAAPVKPEKARSAKAKKPTAG